MTVAVVGAGISGASAARFLAERGHSVTLFEQFGVHHDRGSSHGRSRIVRRAYPDALYTRYMAEAYPLWGELQARTSTPILHECGLIYFGASDSEEMISTARSLQELEVPHESLVGSAAQQVMTQLRLSSNEVGLFTPEAGWVHAERAVGVSLMLAEEAGATLQIGRRVDLQELRRFDAFVVCAGAWIRDFAPLDVQVTKQTFAYFEGTLDGPVWIEASDQNAYGFPSEPKASSFKIGIHRGGDVVDPNSPDRTPSEEAIALASDAASRRFGFADPKVVESKGCLYTVAPNEDFRLGRIGENGFFGSACSGHGFKFGPWIGKLMADFVEGKDSPERYPRFLQP